MKGGACPLQAHQQPAGSRGNLGSGDQPFLAPAARSTAPRGRTPGLSGEMQKRDRQTGARRPRHLEAHVEVCPPGRESRTSAARPGGRAGSAAMTASSARSVIGRRPSPVDASVVQAPRGRTPRATASDPERAAGHSGPRRPGGDGSPATARSTINVPAARRAAPGWRRTMSCGRASPRAEVVVEALPVPAEPRVQRRPGASAIPSLSEMMRRWRWPAVRARTPAQFPMTTVVTPCQEGREQRLVQLACQS